MPSQYEYRFSSQNFMNGIATRSGARVLIAKVGPISRRRPAGRNAPSPSLLLKPRDSPAASTASSVAGAGGPPLGCIFFSLSAVLFRAAEKPKASSVIARPPTSPSLWLGRQLARPLIVAHSRVLPTGHLLAPDQARGALADGRIELCRPGAR